MLDFLETLYSPSINILSLLVLHSVCCTLFYFLHVSFLMLAGLVSTFALDHSIMWVLLFCCLVLVVVLSQCLTTSSFLIAFLLSFLWFVVVISFVLLVVSIKLLNCLMILLLFRFSTFLFLSFFLSRVGWVYCFLILNYWCSVLVPKSFTLTSLFLIHNPFFQHWNVFLSLKTRSVFYSLVQILLTFPVFPGFFVYLGLCIFNEVVHFLIHFHLTCLIVDQLPK